MFYTFFVFKERVMKSKSEGFFTKLWNFLRYASIDKLEAEAVKQTIAVSNGKMLIGFSGVACIIIMVLFVLATINQTSQSEIILFGIGSFVLFILCLLSAILKTRNFNGINVLISIFFLFFTAYGIILAVLVTPSERAVTYIAMLILFPLVFNIAPLYIISYNTLSVVVFCILEARVKTGTLLADDMINAIVFGFVSMLSGIYVVSLKVRSTINERRVIQLSERDALTNLNNRNSYELNLLKYPEKCESRLACFFVDMNCLHDINNKLGHSSGDLHIKKVANELVYQFGNDDCYRIGGDEFVAFSDKFDCAEANRKAIQIRDNLAKAGYYVSVGSFVLNKEELDMAKLVNEAEREMYIEKEKFYKISNLEPR